jgi:hypothetical protein
MRLMATVMLHMLPALHNAQSNDGFRWLLIKFMGSSEKDFIRVSRY